MSSTALLTFICDRSILCGLSTLLIVTPLVVGSVEAWAFVPMEVAIFSLIGVSLVSNLVNGRVFKQPNAIRRQHDRLLLSAGLMAALVAFQLMPLPSRLIRFIAPATFEFYQKSLHGWPNDPLGYRLAINPRQTWRLTGILPTADEVAAGTPIPFKLPGDLERPIRHPIRKSLDNTRKHWRSLSISPIVTLSSLLKLLSYLGLFLLVAKHPFDEQTACKVCRRVGLLVLLAGALVAAIALLGRVYSNGLVGWLFLPYEWTNGNPWGERAVGSFANPDHLANYLDQILPFAIVGAFWPTTFSRRCREATRLFAALVCVLVGGGLLLSSSRGGWLGALTAIAVLIVLCSRKASAISRLTLGRMTAGATVALFSFVLLLLLGPQGRGQADVRLKETINNESLTARLSPAAASLQIIHDFPALGVGLGAWPEIFPRYIAAPWTPVFWNATHNDYVQLACETGMIGFTLALWLAVTICRLIYRRILDLERGKAQFVAAVLAAASATAVHEFFDFPLQIPANAMLLAVLLGLAVRLTDEGKLANDKGISPKLIYRVGLIAVAGLILGSITQNKSEYPYHVKMPNDLQSVYSLISSHPAGSKAHVLLARAMGETTASAGDELRSALWLDPKNPSIRDFYAQTLLEQGQSMAALKQITLSVASSPERTNHLYLSPRIVPWLSLQERKAIETGFAFAVANKYSSAVENFASYKKDLKDFIGEAAIYVNAARTAPTDESRTVYLDNAGIAYASAGKLTQAEASFRSAIAFTPTDVEPYRQLILAIFVPQKRLNEVKKLIAQGIIRGADSYELTLALAAGAEAAKDYGEANTALQKALTIRPSGFEVIMKLSQVELSADRPDLAALYFRRAARLRPNSVEAYLGLAHAEESAYEYFNADQAYQSAIALQPYDPAIKQQYAEFRQRVTRSSQSHN